MRRVRPGSAPALFRRSASARVQRQQRLGRRPVGAVDEEASSRAGGRAASAGRAAPPAARGSRRGTARPAPTTWRRPVSGSWNSVRPAIGERLLDRIEHLHQVGARAGAHDRVERRLDLGRSGQGNRRSATTSVKRFSVCVSGMAASAAASGRCVRQPFRAVAREDRHWSRPSRPMRSPAVGQQFGKREEQHHRPLALAHRRQTRLEVHRRREVGPQPEGVRRPPTPSRARRGGRRAPSAANRSSRRPRRERTGGTARRSRRGRRRGGRASRRAPSRRRAAPRSADPAGRPRCSSRRSARP